MRHNRNHSRRWLLRLQSLSCLTLIFLMLFMSFGSLYSVEVKTTPGVKRTIEDIVDILNEVAVEKQELPVDTDENTAESEDFGFVESETTETQKIKVELPERVNVNLYMFIKILFKLDDASRVIDGALELYSSIGNTDDYNATLNTLYTTMSEARSLVTSDEFVNTLALTVTVMHAFTESTFAGIGMLLMILMTVFLPLALWTLISIMLIGSIITVWSAERWYVWINRCFKAAVRIFALVLAILLFSGTINLAWGLVLCFVACMIGFGVAALLTRFKSRTRDGIKYINILQLATVGKLSGFFIFFICFAKSNLIGQLVTVTVTDVLGNILSEDYGATFLNQFLFTVISFVAIVALFGAFSTFIGTLSRVGGMQKRNKESCMFSTVLCALLVLSPIVASTLHPAISLTTANIGFIVGAFIGILIMLISEIAIPVCRKRFCPNLRETEKDAVLRGLETIETEYFYAED